MQSIALNKVFLTVLPTVTIVVVVVVSLKIAAEDSIRIVDVFHPGILKMIKSTAASTVQVQFSHRAVQFCKW